MMCEGSCVRLWDSRKLGAPLIVESILGPSFWKLPYGLSSYHKSSASATATEP